MTNYTVTTTFGSFRFSGDFAQASSNLYSLPDAGADEAEGFPTPYQVADARHSPERAAALVLEHFGAEYWLDPDADRGETDDGEITYDGKSRADYVASLIVSVEAEATDEEPQPLYYEISPAGGTMWRIRLHDTADKYETLGQADAGEIDGDGQWVGDEDDVLAAATDMTKVHGRHIDNDDLPVCVDGVWVRGNDPR